MRRMTMLTLCAGAVAFASCTDQRETAPASNKELVDAIRELKGSPADSAGSHEIAALRDELREVRRALSEELDKRTRALSDALDDNYAVVKALKTALERQGGAEEIQEAVDKLSGLASNLEANRSTVDSLRAAVESLKASVTAYDPQAFVNMAKDLATKEGEAISARAARDAAEQRLSAAQDSINQLKARIDELEALSTKLSGSDISSHPKVKELKGKVDDLEKAKVELKADFDKMKALAEDYLNQLRDAGLAPGAPARQPVAVPATAAGDGGGYDPAFEATVTSSLISEGTQQYVILSDLDKGELPALGDVLVILDEKQQVLGEMKVTRIFPADKDNPKAAIGSQTLRITRPPVKGDIVRRRRTAEAGAKGN